MWFWKKPLAMSVVGLTFSLCSQHWAASLRAGQYEAENMKILGSLGELEHINRTRGIAIVIQREDESIGLKYSNIGQYTRTHTTSLPLR